MASFLSITFIIFKRNVFLEPLEVVCKRNNEEKSVFLFSFARIIVSLHAK